MTGDSGRGGASNKRPTRSSSMIPDSPACHEFTRGTSATRLRSLDAESSAKGLLARSYSESTIHTRKELPTAPTLVGLSTRRPSELYPLECVLLLIEYLQAQASQKLFSSRALSFTSAESLGDLLQALPPLTTAKLPH
jgi:hypothetical protein